MWLSGGIFQDFCCWATQVHLRAVIQEQKPKSTSRALNKQLQNVWIHLFPSLSWSNKVSLSTLPFVSSLNNMNDMLNFRDWPHKDKLFHKIWENDWKNLETKKLNSSLNSGSVVSSTTPVVYYCDQIKNYCVQDSMFFFNNQVDESQSSPLAALRAGDWSWQRCLPSDSDSWLASPHPSTLSPGKNRISSAFPDPRLTWPGLTVTHTPEAQFALYGVWASQKSCKKSEIFEN